MNLKIHAFLTLPHGEVRTSVPGGDTNATLRPQAQSSETCPKVRDMLTSILSPSWPSQVADTSEIGLLILRALGIPEGPGFEHTFPLPRGVTESEGPAIPALLRTPKASLSLTS